MDTLSSGWFDSIHHHPISNESTTGIVLAGAVSILAKWKVNGMGYSNGAKLTPPMKQVARNASGVAPDLPPKQSTVVVNTQADAL